MGEDAVNEIIIAIKKARENGIEDDLILKELEEDVLEVHNPKLSHRFALWIKGANIKAHEQVVIES